MAFCFYAPSQYAPLLHLRSVIFGVMPFDWLLSLTLTFNSSSGFYANIIFNLCLLDLHPLSYEHS